MVTQINPFQQHVWRSINQLQIGLGQQSVLLTDLTRPQERFIASLIAGIADNQIEPLAKQLKFDAVDAHRIAEALKPVLLQQIMTEPTAEDSLNGELVRVTLNQNTDGFAVLANRASKKVYLNTLGRAGATIATALAKAQVGSIASDDHGRVSKPEISSYLKSLENCARISALDFQFREFGLATKVTNRSFEKASVSILIAQQYVSPTAYAPLMNRELPHIGVVFDQAGATVSPLVRPGETPCLYCLERNRIEQHAAWPVIASQLVTSRIAFDETAACNFAAAVVTKLVTDWIDLGATNDLGQRWSAATGEIESFRIEPSSKCDCLLQLRIKQSQKPRSLAS